MLVFDRRRLEFKDCANSALMKVLQDILGHEIVAVKTCRKLTISKKKCVSIPGLFEG